MFLAETWVCMMRVCVWCEAPARSPTRRHKHKPLMNRRCRSAAQACRSKSKAWGDVPSSQSSYLRAKCDDAHSKVIYGAFPFPIALISSEGGTKGEELAGGQTQCLYSSHRNMFYFGKQKVQGAFSIQHELNEAKQHRCEAEISK